ncbi:hypothetical protein B0H10DRAFT_2104268, partial [Mycena sp. CBHHK59/15]
TSTPFFVTFLRPHPILAIETPLHCVALFSIHLAAASPMTRILKANLVTSDMIHRHLSHHLRVLRWPVAPRTLLAKTMVMGFDATYPNPVFMVQRFVSVEDVVPTTLLRRLKIIIHQYHMALLFVSVAAAPQMIPPLNLTTILPNGNVKPMGR